MAKTAIQLNRQRLGALVEIIDAVLEHPLPALQRAALCFCALTLRSMTTPAQAPAAAVNQARTASRAGTHHHRSRRPHAADSRPRTRRRGESGCHAEGEQSEIGRHRRKDRCRHQSTRAERRTRRHRVTTFRAADPPGLHNNAARTQAGGQVRSYRSARTACD